MSDILERLEHSIAAARAMDWDRLLEDAAHEIRRLRDLRDNWHAVRSKLESQISFLQGHREATQWPARSPEQTLGADPYSRDPLPSETILGPPGQ